MFLNLSNHPSEKWGEEQIAAAKLLGGSIIDWTFPQISADATSEEVGNLARNFYLSIKELKEQDNNLVVHLMGESTFVFALAVRLVFAGIKVVASTTERCSVEKTDSEGNTVKTSVFKFKSFREYSLNS